MRWTALSGALMLAAAVAGACSAPGGGQSAAPQTTTVQRGDLEATVNASGTVMAAADVVLTLGSGGTIAGVFVKPGDRVSAGQKLAMADDSDLKLQLSQADANRASARAKYAQTEAGATAKEILQAQTTVLTAQQRYTQTVAGPTPQDLANAEASVRSAQARLAAVVNSGATPTEIAAAEAQARAADEHLATVRRGADATDIAVAEQKLAQAIDARANLASQLATTKEQARIAMEQAADSLRLAQAQYGAAKLIYDEAVRTGKDPNITCTPNAPCNNKLTDNKLRQYKNDYESKQIAMSQAEQNLASKRQAYEDAVGQYENGVGLKQAEAQVAQAQAALDALRAGPTPEAIAQAEASALQTRSTLAKLREGVKQSDIIQAQAALDQAMANLEKVRAGTTPDDVKIAQAGLDQAEATLKELKDGPQAPDLAVALASLKQAEVAYELQVAKLNQATLKAPFAGVVAAVTGVPGQVVPANFISLVDDRSPRVDLRLAETDVTQVQVGAEARVTFDALPNNTFTGTVAFVSPKATVEQNVSGYVLSVALAPSQAGVRPGMSATVAIVTSRKQAVLLVPNRAIRTAGRERVVDVRYKGLTFSAPVQIGMTGDSMSEVVAGLLEGDTVVLNTAPTARVQPNFGGGPVIRR